MVLAHDPTKVTKITSEIHNAFDALAEYASMTAEEFLSDRQRLAASKYYLIVCIEGCIDLANHIIAKNKYRIPQDYADTFRVLDEKEILNRETAERLMEMARFRNRLIHIYWDVDDDRIHSFLQSDIDDIPAFVEALLDQLR